MGAGKSSKKDPTKEDNYRIPNAGQKFAEEIDENTGDDNSKNAVDQNKSEDSKDQGTEDYKQHRNEVKNELKVDDKSGGKDRNEEDNTDKNEDQDSEDNGKKIAPNKNRLESDSEGILSSKKHNCDLENDGCKSNGGKNESLEDIDSVSNHELESKCDIGSQHDDSDKVAENKNTNDENLKVTQSDTTQSATSNAPANTSSERKRRHVSWNKKVTFKDEDGSIQEEEPKSCDSCLSIIKKGVHIKKQKVVFCKKDSATLTDQEHSSEDKEEDSTREIYICDSCDLQKSKKIVKKKDHDCLQDD